MPSLFESVTDLLGGGDSLNALAKLVDGSAEQARKLTDQSVPALIGALADRAGTDDGRAAVTAMLDSADASVLDNVGAFLEAGSGDAGSGMLATIFGSDLDDFVSTASDAGDLDRSMVRKALPMLTPMLIGLLAKRRSDDNLDEAGVVELLSSERDALGQDGVLDTTGTEAVVAATTTADMEADGGKAEINSSGGGQSAAVGTTAVDVKDDGSARAAEARKALLAPFGSGLDGRAVDDDRNVGLGWLWWALGAVVLVLFLAWLLAMYSDSDTESDADSASSSLPGIGSTTVSEGTSDDDGDDGDGDGSGALGPASPETSVVSDEDLQIMVDSALAGSRTAGLVTDGDVVVTGTVGSEELRSELVGRIERIVGLGAIDDRIMIEAPEADSEDDATEQDREDGRQDEQAADQSGDRSGDESDEPTGETTDDNAADQDAAEEDEDTADPGAGEGDGDTADPGAGEGDGDTADRPAGDDERDEQPRSEVADGLSGLDLVTFGYRSSRITEVGQVVLDRAAQFLEANPDVRVEIGGHTDSDGFTGENQRLSQRRADAVKTYLEHLGIDGDRLEAVGYGESRPLVPNDSARAKAENRRIELVIL